MKSFELHVPRAVLQGAFRWRNLGTLLCLSWASAITAPAVEMLRDSRGTPHIFARAEADGFFGLGYAAAEDRLLQMELIRRKAAGRLAEVFGPDWVDADREARIAGHTAYAPRAFSKLPERWQEALRAYAAGANAWREAHPEFVANRFKPLGIQPEPWTPTDCLLAARGILSLGSPFSTGPVEDYHRFHELIAQVGEAEALRQSSLVIDDSAAIVSEADMAKDTVVFQRLKERERMPGLNLRPAGSADEGRRMSHAWAVSGRRSTTGKPILESDPQLPLSSPPFFYEFHLAAGGIDARGLGIPGCPGLFIGWNRRIAWGASALGVDAHVTFLDRLTADGKGFVFEDQPVPFERRLERIEVKGGPPVIQEVLTSRHGTVFNSLVASPRAGEAYLLYDAQTMDDGANARMMLEVMDAGNWTEFRHALEHYYSPGLHIVYADVDGNLGYHTMVHRPLTPRSPRRALEGWTGRDEVRGRIAFDELPHLLNPDSGAISHANNLPVGSWYPYDLGLATGGTGQTSRSLRLQELLKGDHRFSVDDFERVLHRDDVNPILATFLPIARKVAEEDQINDPAVRGLLEAVEGWDMHEATAERFPAARGLGNTLTPYRGSGLNGVYGAGGGGVANLAREIGKRFTRDGGTPTNTLVRAYLVNWLRASATGGRGAGTDEWTARMSKGRPAARDAARSVTIPYQRTLPHDLPVVDASLDFTSTPLTCLDTGTIWSQPGNLYSQIVDLADVDNSRSMTAPGNAEDGPFRTNQVDLWVRGTTHPAPLSRAKIEAQGVTRTRLAAKPYGGPLTRSASALAPSGGEGGRGPGEGAVRGEATRFIPAIPPVTAATNAAARPLPGRKPDDPRLEAAFRVMLRQGTANEEVDAQLADCRAHVKGNAGLTEQLRNAALLGQHLIEESAAGRLKVQYGSPYVLEKLKALLRDLGNTQSSDSSQPDPGRSSNEGGISQAVSVRIGPRELVRQREEMPFVMDASLAALRDGDQAWFFYHAVDWGKCNEKYRGTAMDPFQTKIWRKSRGEMYDLNGWYDHMHHAGLWLNNLLRTDNGDLLGVVHVELHSQEPNVNQGENYAIGVVHSTDRGDRWTYCGEIVRPKNSQGNIGGTPLLVVGDHLHVYFNEHGPGGRRLAVARAKLAEVLAAARNRTVTSWRKYRDGSWDADGLTGVGSAVLPPRTTRGGHPEDSHADAAYHRAARAYMITSWCYEQGVGRLYLHLSEDGVRFNTQHLVDEEPGQWMPYSTFMAHPDDRETDDMSTVGQQFYVLINHKSATNYGTDTLYRRWISASRTRAE